MPSLSKVVNGDKSGVNLVSPLYICLKLLAMLTGLQNTHWLLAALLLIVLSVTVISMVIGLGMKAKFNNFANRVTLFSLILAHLQLLIGLGVYFASNAHLKLTEEGAIATAEIRKMALEHPLINIIAIILITIGRSGLKRKTTDNAKFRHGLIFFGLGLILIMSRVPWEDLFTLPF